MSFDSTYNPYSLVGKTILITGASSGIGRATAIECSKLGATCILTGRNEERLQETLAMMIDGEHQYIVADISTEEGLYALVEQSPVLDGLVNNAGVGRNKPIAFYKQEDLNYIYQTNVFSPMLLTKGLLKKKKLRTGASIVFTSSIAAYETNFGNGIYGSSKSALMAYMRYCAQELSSKNIRANAIHPGMVETPLIHCGTFTDENLEKDMQKYPLKRYGKAEEIAWAIIYLLSDASAWVTGTSLVIDGGRILSK